MFVTVTKQLALDQGQGGQWLRERGFEVTQKVECEEFN